MTTANSIHNDTFMCTKCFNLVPMKYTVSIKFNSKDVIEIGTSAANMIQQRSLKAKCKHCGSVQEFAQIDNNIADTISILNKKGYTTEFCCEGHDTQKGFWPDTYIKFKKGLFGTNQKTIKKWEKYLHIDTELFNFDGTCMRGIYGAIDFDKYGRTEDKYEIEKLVELHSEVLYKLYRWANSLLPYNKNAKLLDWDHLTDKDIEYIKTHNTKDYINFFNWQGFVPAKLLSDTLKNQ